MTVRSEDASVNAGAATWPSFGQAFVAVRRIQNKLHCWAGADSGRRFDDLYNLVSDTKVLTMAWERVAGNTGARTAGVDRATVAWIVARYGVETFLRDVCDQLRSRTFTPDPVRRVMIPKASGKLRALGIPTVTDRVVQAALKLVLEPIFEADFAPVSYGFRPNRRAQDAIAEIHHFTTKSYQWVLEADIEACIESGRFSKSLDPAAALHVLWVGMLGAATIGLTQRLAPGEDPDALAHDVLESLLGGFTTNIRTTFVASDCALSASATSRTREASSTLVCKSRIS